MPNSLNLYLCLYDYYLKNQRFGVSSIRIDPKSNRHSQKTIKKLNTGEVTPITVLRKKNATDDRLSYWEKLKSKTLSLQNS